MKKFLLALFACLLATPLAFADTSHASLTYVRRSHHKAQHHHAHHAAKHKARRKYGSV